VQELRRIGKRIAIAIEGDLWLVLHLMIAGRPYWRPPQAKLAEQKPGSFAFATGCLVLTEAGTRPRASLLALAGDEALRSVDPGGIDVLTSDLSWFLEFLMVENRTLKRTLPIQA
jgi:formamidopyrimidine-DNA glycosylase